MGIHLVGKPPVAIEAVEDDSGARIGTHVSFNGRVQGVFDKAWAGDQVLSAQLGALVGAGENVILDLTRAAPTDLFEVDLCLPLWSFGADRRPGSHVCVILDAAQRNEPPVRQLLDSMARKGLFRGSTPRIELYETLEQARSALTRT